MKVWTALALVVAAVLYTLSLSTEVYAITSPATLPWHIVLRKGYSIVAFALVGYLFGRAALELRWKPSVLNCSLTVALYSASIEFGQALHGSQEGLAWNAFDTLCGAIGGALGALALRRS